MESQIYLKSIFGDNETFNETRAIFSDESLIKYFLNVEVALAKVQSEIGIIPVVAYEAIKSTVESGFLDLGAYLDRTAVVGFPIVGLVEQLSSAVPNSLGSYVHWGATTQDIMDTALMLQLKDFLDIQEAVTEKIISVLVSLAHKHRETLMIGRSQLQHGLPITFGYKVALWVSPLRKSLERLRQLRMTAVKVQFGGAVGTLASLGDKGEEVRAALASELGLAEPKISWHTSREALIEIAQVLVSLTGSLGKIGKDIILLAQTEVGAVKESHIAGRGTSSTMPQKQNPMSAQTLVVAAHNVSGQMNLLHHALLNDHERGTATWQLEWTAIPDICVFSAGSTGVAVDLFAGLRVLEDRMSKNLKLSGGAVLAEAVMMKVAEKIGRQAAHDMVHEVIMDAEVEGLTFREAVLSNVELLEMFSVEEIEAMLDYSSYLGVSLEVVDAL